VRTSIRDCINYVADCIALYRPVVSGEEAERRPVPAARMRAALRPLTISGWDTGRSRVRPPAWQIGELLITGFR
jgi:hypothetical protein